MVGWVFVAFGLLAIGGLVRAGFGTDRINVTTAVLFALPAAIAALGLHLALRPAVVIELDLADRTYAVIRNGTRGGPGPLAALGPLAVSRRTRVVGRRKNRRTVVEYVVNPAAHPQIDLFVMRTPKKARHQMEKLARAWFLPCQSRGGGVRAAGDLDKPLHERLRGDRPALTTVPLRPEWGVRIEPLSPGCAMVSTHRSWTPLAHGAVILLPALVLIPIGYTEIMSFLQEARADLLGRSSPGSWASSPWRCCGDSGRACATRSFRGRSRSRSWACPTAAGGWPSIRSKR
jgi:hypothetical protein